MVLVGEAPVAGGVHKYCEHLLVAEGLKNRGQIYGAYRLLWAKSV